MGNMVLIRPGCTDFDDQHRIQGSLDLPLNDRGRDQVDQVVESLQDSSISVIYSAPSEPALSTANALSEGLGVKVREKNDLRNIDQGLWQGLQVDDIRRKYPKVYKQWCDSPETICPPDGETVPDALRRVSRALKKPLRNDAVFAVVVPEPLATLFGCYVEGRKPELPTSIGGEQNVSQFEYLTPVELEQVVAGSGNRDTGGDRK